MGRGLWRLSRPTALLRQGQLQQAAQAHIKTVLNISMDGDATNSLVVCIHSLLCFHCAPLEEAWLCSPCTLPSGIHRQE